MKDEEGRTLCTTCGKPLNGHCVICNLGDFCEDCVYFGLLNYRDKVFKNRSKN